MTNAGRGTLLEHLAEHGSEGLALICGFLSSLALLTALQVCAFNRSWCQLADHELACRQLHAHKAAVEKERQAEMELLNADPFDIEAQAKIAERIRQAQARSLTNLLVHLQDERLKAHHTVP